MRLETFTGSEVDPVPTLIDRLRQTRLDLVATVAADVTSDDATSRGLAVAYPSPMSRATAVLAQPAGGDLPGSRVTTVTSALRARGWTDDPAAPTGLPDTTTMVALLLFGRSVHQ